MGLVLIFFFSFYIFFCLLGGLDRIGLHSRAWFLFFVVEDDGNINRVMDWVVVVVGVVFVAYEVALDALWGVTKSITKYMYLAVKIRPWVPGTVCVRMVYHSTMFTS